MTAQLLAEALADREPATMTGGKGWRDVFYDLTSDADVIDHLVWNCVMNHRHSASELDGWADLPREAATMQITDSETL